MPVPENMVGEMAALARLRLSRAEAESMASDLEAILDFVDVLAEAPDLEVEEPSSSGGLRPDDAGGTLTREEALANAPELVNGLFAVPRFLPEE